MTNKELKENALNAKKKDMGQDLRNILENLYLLTVSMLWKFPHKL